jgi:hypothetical protein
MSGTWQQSLATVGAPSELSDWARTQPSLATAWAACPRPDWLVWLARSHPGSNEEQRNVVRAAASVASFAGAKPPVWHRLLLRWRPDLFDQAALFVGADELTDSDHQYSDLINGLLFALLLWAPLDVFLFVHPVGSLGGLRREVITLPVLFVLIWPVIWVAGSRR